MYISLNTGSVTGHILGHMVMWVGLGDARETGIIDSQFLSAGLPLHRVDLVSMTLAPIHSFSTPAGIALEQFFM